MSKINITHILRAHIKTLYGDDDKFPIYDIFLFFFIPFILGLSCAYLMCDLSKDVYGIAISVFSIFSALLINAQVAIFGISQREKPSHNDQQIDKLLNDEYKMRRILLSQINTNISYLIVVSCLSLIVFVVFYIFDQFMSFEIFMTFFLFSHFLATLMMVIKRSHALFQREYERDE